MLRVARFLPNCRNVSTSQPRAKEMRYSEQRIIGFSRDQMFSVVENVAGYKEFVPWCRKSEIITEHQHSMEARLEIGFPPFVESYVSRVTFIKPSVVHSVVIEDSLFRKLETTFLFGEGLKGNSQTCTLHYDLVFEFRSALHARMAHVFFNQVVKTMVSAFLKQAEKTYGAPVVPHGEGKVLIYQS